MFVRPFTEVPSLEARALAMSHMRKTLEAIAQHHAAHFRWITPDQLGRRIGWHENTPDLIHNHVCAAEMAGFVEMATVGPSPAKRLRLTDKGRAVIGAQKPFYEVTA